MIIVTANVGLLPFEIGKKGAYTTGKRVGFIVQVDQELPAFLELESAIQTDTI